MSNEGMKNIEGFINFCEENQEAAERMKLLDLNDHQAIIGLAREQGFVFTEEDMNEYGQKVLSQKDELSDQDMEQVAGGNTQPNIVVVGIGPVAMGRQW